MWVFTVAYVFSAPSIEQSVMILGVTKVVVVAMILKNEDVTPLEVDVILMEADILPLRKNPGNVGAPWTR